MIKETNPTVAELHNKANRIIKEVRARVKAGECSDELFDLIEEGRQAVMEAWRLSSSECTAEDSDVR